LVSISSDSVFGPMVQTILVFFMTEFSTSCDG
jgi:hypothetical protein